MYVLFLLGCIEAAPSGPEPEATPCDKWEEVPSLVEGTRCFTHRSSVGHYSWGGLVCYPEDAPFNTCVKDL